MTAEWIDGIRLSDRHAIGALMGELESNPPLLTSPSLPPSQISSKPLKGGLKAIMQPMVELFSAQMFNWGWVHCDPHPGNIIIREHPSRPGYPQLVLIDHGLYVSLDEDFRREWVALWRGMLTGDFGIVEQVTKRWGIGVPDLMASATLMKPVKLHKSRGGERKKNKMKEEKVDTELSQYEMSLLMKKKLKEFLKDTDNTPKVLIFLMRNMRFVDPSPLFMTSWLTLLLTPILAWSKVRHPSVPDVHFSLTRNRFLITGNNQSFFSPVNRIKITGFWASRSLSSSPNLTLTQRLREYWHHLVFRVIMFSIDFGFWKNKVIGWARQKLGLRVGEGFEDKLERNMRGIAKATFGVEVDVGAFDG
jgi:aarF domain-containing kinase